MATPNEEHKASRPEPQSFESVYSDLYTLAFWTIFPIVHDSCASEELTHEVLMRYLKNIDRIDRTAPKPWLRKVARNLAIDHLRSPKNKPSVDEEALEVMPAPLIDLDDQVNLSDQLSLLRRFLDKLPVNQHTVIDLRYLRQRTWQEIAVTLGITVAACKGLRQRGLARLQRLFRESDKSDS